MEHFFGGILRLLVEFLMTEHDTFAKLTTPGPKTQKVQRAVKVKTCKLYFRTCHPSLSLLN